MARENHPDKTAPNDSRIKELNEAKDACVEAIVARTCAVDGCEFVLHIAHILEKSLEERAGLAINLLEDGNLIQP